MHRVPRPKFPCCTYCHQIGHQINECSFIEDNVRQGFVEHFQNLNAKFAKIKNHGHIEPKGLYHEKVRIPYRLIEHIWRQNRMEIKNSNCGRCNTYFCSSYNKSIASKSYWNYLCRNFKF